MEGIKMLVLAALVAVAGVVMAGAPTDGRDGQITG